MNIYEFVTPSDAITFEAETDQVAFIVGLLLGSGKAAVGRLSPDPETFDKKYSPMIIFCQDHAKEIVNVLGETAEGFVKKHLEQIKQSMASFLYGGLQDRETYKKTVDLITDPEKKEEFKKLHEDSERTSMSRWVQSAWNMSKSLKIKEDAD